jgi:hypothetical protein
MKSMSCVGTTATISRPSDRSLTQKPPSIIQCREQVQHLEIPFHIHNTFQDFRILARVIMGIPHIHWPALKILTFSGCPESVASVGGRRDTTCHLSITDIVAIPTPTFWYPRAYSLLTTGFILWMLRLQFRHRWMNLEFGKGGTEYQLTACNKCESCNEDSYFILRKIRIRHRMQKGREYISFHFQAQSTHYIAIPPKLNTTIQNIT